MPAQARVSLFTVWLLIACVGCGDSAYDVAPVRGRVLCNGKPVGSGVIAFTPVGGVAGRTEGSGKPAMANVQSDGTFVLTTYEDGDGALVGEHAVSFRKRGWLPIDQASFNALPPEEQQRYMKLAGPKPAPISCGTDISPATVEVTSSENVFEFELGGGGDGPRRQASPATEWD